MKSRMVKLVFSLHTVWVKSNLVIFTVRCCLLRETKILISVNTAFGAERICRLSWILRQGSKHSCISGTIRCGSVKLRMFYEIALELQRVLSQTISYRRCTM